MRTSFTLGVLYVFLEVWATVPDCAEFRFFDWGLSWRVGTGVRLKLARSGVLRRSRIPELYFWLALWGLKVRTAKVARLGRDGNFVCWVTLTLSWAGRQKIIPLYSLA